MKQRMRLKVGRLAQLFAELGHTAGACGGADEKCHPQSHTIECSVSRWWCCFQGLGVWTCWRRSVTEGRFWEYKTCVIPSELCLLPACGLRWELIAIPSAIIPTYYQGRVLPLCNPQTQVNFFFYIVPHSWCFIEKITIINIEIYFNLLAWITLLTILCDILIHTSQWPHFNWTNNTYHVTSSKFNFNPSSCEQVY